MDSSDYIEDMETKETLNDNPKTLNGLNNDAGNIPLTDLAKTEEKVRIDEPPKFLIYGLKDRPPIHITIICGLQVYYELFNFNE